MTQRRRQVDHSTSSKNKNESNSPIESKRHRPSAKMRSSRFYLRYGLILIVVALLYLAVDQLIIPFLFVEKTNVPLDLPKLVSTDSMAAERFWGTYR